MMQTAFFHQKGQRHGGMTRRPVSIIILCSLILASLTTWTGCTRQTGPVQRTDFLFNTVVTLTLNAPADETILNDTMAYCRTFEKIFSRTDEDSELYTINHRPAGSRTVTLSDDLAAAIAVGLDYARLSDGALDLTMGRVISLWDFTAKQPKLPSEDAIAEALQSVDWQGLQLEGNTLTFPNDEMQLDLGAIAKGYIADRVKEYLTAAGVTSAIIDLGGNLLCIGSRVDGSAYTLGVQKPFGSASELSATVSVKDRSLVTSGIYERCFTLDGTLYHHLLDPATGWPCANELASVTIYSARSVDGDALSTACFVLGLEKGMALINRLDDVEALFITQDGTLCLSENAPSYFTAR